MPDSSAATAPLSPLPSTGPRPASPRTTLSSPAPEVPLAGLTLLAVEDSRVACDGLRLMAQRSGARLRRAETLEAADRHLRTYRPDVVLVDPGLPDGDGLSLVASLAARAPAAPPVLVVCGEPGQEAAARAAGARGFLAKPVPGLRLFRRTVLACLPDRAWLAAADWIADGDQADDDLPAPDILSLRDDLAAAARRLAAGPDEREGRYLAGFLAGIARATGDAGLAAAAAHAARPGSQALPALAGVVAARLAPAPTSRLVLG